MKKRGFTLAEVLVAMALVGVIASLTIPTFVSSSRNKANATKLATTISAVENAFTSMIASEGASDLTETEIIDGNGEVYDLEKKLGEYLKITKMGEVTPKYKKIGGTTLEEYKARNGFYLTKNGAVLGFEYQKYKPINPNKLKEITSSIKFGIAELVIDVNGMQSPNTFGRDAFSFILGDDGSLYPAGSKEFSLVKNNSALAWDDPGSPYPCKNNSKTIGCTARLIENNFEVDY